MIFGVSIKKCSGVSIFAPGFWLLASGRKQRFASQPPAASSEKPDKLWHKKRT